MILVLSRGISKNYVLWCLQQWTEVLECQSYPGLQQSASWPSIKRGMTSRSKGLILPLLRSLEAPPGVLHSTLVLQAWERHGPVQVGPEEDYKVNSRLEHLFWEENLRELRIGVQPKWDGFRKSLLWPFSI